MNLTDLITRATSEMSGLLDKLNSLKEKLQDQLPDFNLQGRNKKQLIYIPVRVADQDRNSGKSGKGS